MRALTILLGILVLATSASADWSHKKIASGSNGPQLDLAQPHFQELLLRLHEGLPPQQGETLRQLSTAGLVREATPGVYRPTVMVMSLAETARFMPVDSGLVEQATALVQRMLPQLRQQYARLSCASAVPFEDASLFLLSDVLLDNWQIRQVENLVLKAERPLRQGGRFYYALQEDVPGDGLEAFAIYGNHVRTYGPYVLGVYGNRREDNPHNFHLLTKEQLERISGADETPGSLEERKQKLLQRIQGGAVFEEIGPVLVLSRDDVKSLESMAQPLTADLVRLLQQHRKELESRYAASPYRDEVTFEEYFIWWYHLFYTAVTERLREAGDVRIPAAGIATYLVVP